MSQSIQRAAEVLELVAQEPRTQAEIAARLGVHRSTALRTLQTLCDAGLTRRRADGRYGLGYRLAGLANVAAEQFDLREIARPALERLGRECRHTVHLAALDGDAIVYVDKIEQPGMVRLYSQIGQRVVLHTAGVSKAILAFQPSDVVERMLQGHEFTAHTTTTITNRPDFDRALAAVRERGWAEDDAEYEDFANCVAMPVRDAGDSVVAAVSITSLRASADLGTLRGLTPLLAETTAGISRDLGWRPAGPETTDPQEAYR
ncbi:IclR family transcriptional regulator [Ruicaihuangia caeni]|uniref:IclR family transcriptional regulator n=1 Tax=Ruicaihuangia caeni TaxID=3042517 RepID=A0AAW6T679_9MICO|nr:IclR family transcriptional regulator [Klugiella sp. YN-L-19]MDI2098999.1 IclR family transcriptional regulator [Klugiella sp. YN-L-19]